MSDTDDISLMAGTHLPVGTASRPRGLPAPRGAGRAKKTQETKT